MLWRGLFKQTFSMFKATFGEQYFRVGGPPRQINIKNAEINEPAFEIGHGVGTELARGVLFVGAARSVITNGVRMDTY